MLNGNMNRNPKESYKDFKKRTKKELPYPRIFKIADSLQDTPIISSSDGEQSTYYWIGNKCYPYQGWVVEIIQTMNMWFGKPTKPTDWGSFSYNQKLEFARKHRNNVINIESVLKSKEILYEYLRTCSLATRP